MKIEQTSKDTYMKSGTLSLKTKLLVLSAFLSLVPIVVGVVSATTVGKVTHNYDEIVDQTVPALKESYEMMLSYRRVRITLRTLGLTGITAQDADQAIKEMQEAVESYEKHEETYNAMTDLPGQKDVDDKTHETWVSFKATGAEVLRLWKSGKPEDLAKIHDIFMNDCPEKAKVFTVAMKAQIGFHEGILKQRSDDAKQTASTGSTTILLVIVSGVAVGLAFALILVTKTNRAISLVSKDLAGGAEQVSQAASQIAMSAQSLSQASVGQASSLEETVATVEELTSMVRLNSENGRQAAGLAVATRDIAVKGEKEIRTLIQSIQSISADSKQIADITNVIDDIAFQTNLLALNAAVEAARAGEQGRGFAVVAEAVRALAQRSASAAKDIAGLIKNSVEKIEAGAEQANQGGEVLAEIVTSVKKVADLNQEIANASEEQSNGIVQIGKALNQLDEVTQQNASASEESAAASEELASQSHNLKNSVATLDSIVMGSSGSQAEPAIRKIESEANYKKPFRPQQSAKVLTGDFRAKKAAPASAKSTAKSVIPFDEDEDSSPRKVGTIDDF